MRKIIQIAVSEAGATNGYSRNIVALADDGTLWERDVSCENGKESDTPSKWRFIPALPEV